MADSNRKVFPVKTVMALMVGNDDVDIKEIAGFITGRSICCNTKAKAVGVFAAAWLARIYPQLADMTQPEGMSFETFVSNAKAAFDGADSVSLTPMDDKTMETVGKVFAFFDDAQKSVAAQTEACVKLEKRVQELEPVAAQAQNLQKKVDELEGKIKTMKTDMGGLNRKIAEFDGKVAIAHDELMDTIKDAIKSNLKGLVAAGAAGAAAGAAGEAAADAAAEPEEQAVPDTFGFGSSGADSDGSGF